MSYQNHIQEIVKQHDIDQYYAGLLMPEEYRRKYFTLVAFNGELVKIREQTQEAMIAEIKLQWWRDALTAFSAKKERIVREHPILLELDALQPSAEVIQNMQAIIEARSFDLYEQGPQSWTALTDYVENTSGLLNETAVLWSLGATETKTGYLAQAKSAGSAWGMVNIILAVTRHALSGKSFIPGEEWNAGHQFSQEELEKLRVKIEKMQQYCLDALSNAGSKEKDLRPFLALNAISKKYCTLLKRENFMVDKFSGQQISRIGRLWLILKNNFF